ncbi:MAG: CBS domain-containing protein [Myxococcota bacterium]
MKTSPVFMSPDDDCQKVAQHMRDRNLGFLPVCDEYGEPVGTITDRDLCLRICAEDRRASQTKVSDVMTHHVVSCSPEDDISEAEELMSRHKKGRVMVLENGKLIGVISLSDVARRDTEEKAGHTLREIVSREVRA